ncbi:uncharacterized protein N7459_006938 [Penicillium hispanicum]|uniref:uncharacterized protein n=1 Tax=Penicillium hispanicum TaxID=1080232 RepID=UPI00253FD24D|nr:uncharacterized protein N7459_006938 [Penicillium hispanicum]KAJ5577974.1 hypothetical protein N7459_006938 [Penicillium hispanicum]
MATSFPYLLDTILALSALHLASVETNHRHFWIDAAMKYQGQACSGLGRVLQEITPQHYGPAFVSSVFIMLYATGFPVISSDDHAMDPIMKVTEVRTLISGSAMLFDRLNETGREGDIHDWLCVPDTEESLANKERNGNIMQSLGRTRTIIDTTESSNKLVYRSTWQLLQHTIEPWPKIGIHGGVIAWPLFISDEYLAVLRDGDWVARILFLHYAVAMRLVGNRWYVRDWGRRLVLATLEPLEEIPSMWTDTISWMRTGLDIDV